MKSFLTTCFILLATLLSGCAQPEPPFRIGTNQWSGYEPLYMARSLGYFEGTPIMLAEYLSTTDVVNHLRNDSLEAAGITLDEALTLLHEGFDIKIILVFDYSNGADALVARSGIRDVKELKGKKIGMEAMAAGAYILSRAMEKEGLRPSDIIIIPLSPSEHEKAFRTGAVDAVVTFEPTLTRILEAGGNKIFDSSMIPGEILDVLVVRTDVLKKQPKAAKYAINGWFKALAYLKSNPEDASKIMARRSHVTGEEFIKSLYGVHFPDFAENKHLLAGVPAGIFVPVQKLNDILLENRFIKKRVDPESIVDATPLMEARP